MSTMIYSNDQLPYEVLHSHTTLSDGKLTHLEILDLAKSNEIGLVAFTDHDSPMSQDLFSDLKKKRHPVKFISGIEITVNFLDDERKTKSSDLHIVGLFVNPGSQLLIDHEQKSLIKREEGARKMIDALKNHGLTLSFDEVAKLSAGQIGRPHIVSVLLSHPENQTIIDQDFAAFINALHEKNESAETIQTVKDHIPFKRMFDLYLGPTAFIPGIYIESRNDVTLNEAISMIRNSGGYVFPAHWSDYQSTFTPEILEKFCQEKKIDGIETNYGYWKEGVDLEKVQSDVLFLKSLCEKYHLMQSGGGDYHFKDDFTQCKKPAYKVMRDETIGLLGRMQQTRNDLDLSWSSLKEN